jgi:hypothetical protein
LKQVRASYLQAKAQLLQANAQVPLVEAQVDISGGMSESILRHASEAFGLWMVAWIANGSADSNPRSQPQRIRPIVLSA